MMKIKVVNDMQTIHGSGEASTVLDPNAAAIHVNVPGVDILLYPTADEAAVLAAKFSALSTAIMMKEGQK
jgi:hypothetical protein